MKLLNGKDLAAFVESRQLQAVQAIRQNHQVIPKLAIITTTQDSLVDGYINLKRKYATRIGADTSLHRVSQPEIAPLLDQLNQDKDSHGIIIQLPLDDKQETDYLCGLINPAKDVDGLNPDGDFDSATATAVNWLLAGYNIDLKGKKIVIIGKGKLVGEPLADIWHSSGHQVTAMDQEDLSWPVVEEADLVVSATGHSGLVGADHLAKDAVVVDAGTAIEKGKVLGDIAQDVYQLRDDLTITPAKGGLGPVTIAVLFENLILATRNSIAQP